MKIINHTCPFTGGDFKIMHTDRYPAFKFTHALTGEEFTASIVDGYMTIPVKAFEPVACVTLSKTAKMLGVSKQHVTTLVKNGKIQAIKFNGRYRIVKDSVENYDAMTRGRKW